jgi:hypothetical protein
LTGESKSEYLSDVAKGLVQRTATAFAVVIVQERDGTIIVGSWGPPVVILPMLEQVVADYNSGAARVIDKTPRGPVS